MKSLFTIMWTGLFAVSSLICTSGEAKENIFKVENKKNQSGFKHNIQLQLYDADGFPVPDTAFWVTLDISKKDSKVMIQLPLINFQTGPFANDPSELPPLVSGGYLYTADGFLPKHLRPTDIVYRSWNAPSNNGMSLPFSFNDAPPYGTFPPPEPVSYILSVTNAGAIVIQGAGQPGNIIPTGPQILLPTDITYLVQPSVKLRKNTKLSTGATDTTQFTDARAASDGLRNRHVNDAFDGVAVWAWADNSMIADKTSNATNAVVAVGKVNKQGKLKVSKPIQLSDFGPGFLTFDTSVAINRTNKKNIVVSYGVVNINVIPSVGVTYRAVSFDGGKTWPQNGPTNVQAPSGSFGFYRGVGADKYGNIWLNISDANDSDQPFFAVSTDGGVNFTTVYTLPPLPPGETNHVPDYTYHIPDYTFGGDGLGNYGLIYSVPFQVPNTDRYPTIGFIPITGLGATGTPIDPVVLYEFDNNMYNPLVTASQDGRIWLFGVPLSLGSGIMTHSTLFKSPGALDLNYAGPWNYSITNLLDFDFLTSIYKSQPVIGYYATVGMNIYDDNRQALYQVCGGLNPDFSQNSRLYFGISRDNAQTWSNTKDINNKNRGNRGFESMMLDTVRGDLYFGWYDGRNDPTFKTVEYFGGVIPAKELNKLVNEIPLSNPLFSLPSAGGPLPPVGP